MRVRGTPQLVCGALCLRPAEADILFYFQQKILNSTNREIHGSAPNQDILIPLRRRLPENLFDLVCVYSF